MKTRLLVRMTAPIMLLSMIPLAGGIAAAWQVHHSQQQASAAVARNLASMRAAEELVIVFHQDVRAKLHLFLLSKAPPLLEDIPGVRPKTDRWLEMMERTSVTPKEQELAGRVRKGYESFFAEFTGLLRDPTVERVRRLADVTLTRDILQPAQEYLDINEEEITESNADNERAANRLVVGLLLLGVCGPVSGLLAGYGISRAVSRSIVRLSVPIRDAAGKLNEIVGPITLAARWGLEELEGVLRIIAERIGAVIARLQQREREAREAEHLAAVGQMAAGIAHELRNPLMPMKILVQAAAERAPSPGLDGRDLAVLEHEIGRLEHSIQTFLDFARPPRLEKRPFDVALMLREVADLLAARAAQQEVRIECRVPGRPVQLFADTSQVRQVVLNLLLNALDATPHGGTVLLELQEEEGKGPPHPQPLSPLGARGENRPPHPQPLSPLGEKGARQWLTLRVSDTGCGLPAGLGPRIFEPFVSTKETGLGLGLSICKRIVEAHEGEIQSADRPGGGAVFTVRLPVTATPQ
jgi:two-component system sensor histidine kinase HydH